MNNPLDYGNLNINLAKEVGHMVQDIGSFKQKQYQILKLIEAVPVGDPSRALLNQIRDILMERVL